MNGKRQFREPGEETRAKMSAKKAGCNNPNYGMPRSTDTKKAISDALKAYWENIPSKNNNQNNNNA
ncbi:hypothetical protein AGMMS4957_03720 [Bacteroidia bacterium]|nr:hypothetical protein AGMMS4957_03560 [Bacteroidia bacterium]GHT19444.1 hypothetical protein AGMMS4957_03720 [Bacteroidia bacterium]